MVYRRPIPIWRNIWNNLRNGFVFRDAAVMSGNPREQTKTELSIFRRRRSIRFRSRPQPGCSVSGSRSARVIWTKTNESNGLSARDGLGLPWKMPARPWNGIAFLVDHVERGRIEQRAFRRFLQLFLFFSQH